MKGTEGVVAALLIVGMIDPCVESERGVGEGLVDLEKRSVEREVVVGDVIADTSGDSGADGVVDFEIGDTTSGIHELECNGDVGDRLRTVVDHTEGNCVFFKIDTTGGSGRANLGDGDVIVERRVDADVDLRIVTGAVAGAEAAEVVEAVVEVLGSGTPVSGTDILVVTIVEEVAANGVAMPTDGT